jgi:uncharacterized MAPEG superfamily protein
MTWAFWCILIAGLLPYLGAMFAKWGFKDFDNDYPRDWLAKQTGFRARANAAQANSFESFPLFASAVLVATYLQVPTTHIDSLATIYILARVAFLYCYLRNLATYRTIAWVIGLLSVCGLFVAAGLVQ